MARLRATEFSGLWAGRILSEPAYDPLASDRNGRYRGRLPVRRIPRGVSGGQLAAGTEPAPGQVWRRGQQLVRILAIEPPAANRGRMNSGWVRFKEVTFGEAERRVRTAHFLRTSRMERGA